jgi:hypothetical protein
VHCTGICRVSTPLTYRVLVPVRQRQEKAAAAREAGQQRRRGAHHPRRPQDGDRRSEEARRKARRGRKTRSCQGLCFDHCGCSRSFRSPDHESACRPVLCHACANACFALYLISLCSCLRCLYLRHQFASLILLSSSQKAAPPPQDDEEDDDDEDEDEEDDDMVGGAALPSPPFSRSLAAILLCPFHPSSLSLYPRCPPPPLLRLFAGPPLLHPLFPGSLSSSLT